MSKKSMRESIKGALLVLALLALAGCNGDDDGSSKPSFPKTLTYRYLEGTTGKALNEATGAAILEPNANKLGLLTPNTFLSWPVFSPKPTWTLAPGVPQSCMSVDQSGGTVVTGTAAQGCYFNVVQSISGLGALNAYVSQIPADAGEKSSLLGAAKSNSDAETIIAFDYSNSQILVDLFLDVRETADRIEIDFAPCIFVWLEGNLIQRRTFFAVVPATSKPFVLGMVATKTIFEEGKGHRCVRV